MDADEAATILAAHLGSYRRLGYEALAGRVGTFEVAELEGASAERYRLEVQFTWDAAPRGDVRVLGSIDDGSLRYFVSPITDDFIVAPDGRFVGE